ncbi:hypothetical protein [Sphaerochaeta sp.]|uniref:hypothetical protein n=1 Tax=Sphaerochaeta sp. TaxID=1972642 RepID=UPI003D0A81A9
MQKIATTILITATIFIAGCAAISPQTKGLVNDAPLKYQYVPFKWLKKEGSYLAVIERKNGRWEFVSFIDSIDYYEVQPNQEILYLGSDFGVIQPVYQFESLNGNMSNFICRQETPLYSACKSLLTKQTSDVFSLRAIDQDEIDKALAESDIINLAKKCSKLKNDVKNYAEKMVSIVPNVIDKSGLYKNENINYAIDYIMPKDMCGTRDAPLNINYSIEPKLDHFIIANNYANYKYKIPFQGDKTVLKPDITLLSKIVDLKIPVLIENKDIKAEFILSTTEDYISMNFNIQNKTKSFMKITDVAVYIEDLIVSTSNITDLNLPPMSQVDKIDRVFKNDEKLRQVYKLLHDIKINNDNINNSYSTKASVLYYTNNIPKTLLDGKIVRIKDYIR